MDVRATGDRIEELLEKLQVSADPRTLDVAEELLRMVTELYGEGLARVVQLVRSEAPELLPVLVDDELLASLMVVHDLHPDDLAARVEGALQSVRPFLGAHGGDVELLGLDGRIGAVHLRLLGSCDGCPSSAVTLRTAVEQAIADAAPEITTIDVEEPSREVATPVEIGRRPSPLTQGFDPATGCGVAVTAEPLDAVASR
jgi:Fe-S cluster biogenesis protein NfuA